MIFDNDSNPFVRVDFEGSQVPNAITFTVNEYESVYAM